MMMTTCPLFVLVLWALKHKIDDARTLLQDQLKEEIRVHAKLSQKLPKQRREHHGKNSQRRKQASIFEGCSEWVRDTFDLLCHQIDVTIGA